MDGHGLSSTIELRSSPQHTLRQGAILVGGQADSFTQTNQLRRWALHNISGDQIHAEYRSTFTVEASETNHGISRFTGRWGRIISSHPEMLNAGPSNHYAWCKNKGTTECFNDQIILGAQTISWDTQLHAKSSYRCQYKGREVDK